MDLNQAIKETAMVLQQSVQGCDEFDAGTQVLAAARAHADWLESFPSDEDVEVAANAVYTRRWGPSMSGPRPGVQDYDIAHAALQAVVNARRIDPPTEED